MAQSDILSQDEIDALLSGVDGGDVETESDEGPREGAQPFDFTSQERIIRGRLPTLEMINERFARDFRISLFGMLRKAAEISIEGVEMMKFSEYINTLFVPTSLTLVQMKPLRGTALVMVDSKLLFLVVDNFFGGQGRHAKIEGREFTSAELRVNDKMLDLAFTDLKKAWEPVKSLDFEVSGHEMNPQLANIISPSEIIVVCQFTVELEGGEGAFHIAMPYSMIEPIRDQLEAGVQSERLEIDERWSKALRRELATAEVEVSSTLAKVELQVSDLLNMQPGDVIRFEMPEYVYLEVEELPMFYGKYGIHGENHAVRIDGRAGDEPGRGRSRQGEDDELKAAGVKQ